MLSTLKGEIVRAGKLGVTLGAFNVYTAEQARGVVQAAKKHGAPIFLQSNFANIQAAGGGPFVTYLKELARHADVPVAIHLDHGQSLDEVVQALVMGFTSVMFDGSSLPFEENVAKTKEVVRLARSVGATVEGELGAIGGDEDRALSGSDGNGLAADAGDASMFTDPKQAEVFVKETGVDILAVAVGNVHGLYKGEPKLRFDLLDEIHHRSKTALALHGASGLAASDLRRAAQTGVVKVNFNTDLRQAYAGAMKSWLDSDGGQLNLTKLRDSLVDHVAEVVSERLGWLGSGRLSEAPTV